MSIDAYYQPDEPEFTDAEWDLARERLADDLVATGMPRTEAYRCLDDWTIQAECERARSATAADHADHLYHLAKDEGLL